MNKTAIDQESKRKILFAVLVIAILAAAFSAAYLITSHVQNGKDPSSEGLSAGETVVSGTAQTTDKTDDAASTTAANTSETTGSAAAETTTVKKEEKETTASTTAPAAKPTEPAAKPPVSGDVTEPTYIGGILIANKTYPLPRDYNPGGLTDECESAFYEMEAAASELGLDIYIASGFRSYDTQASIYQRYCNEDGQAEADTYSARPGHSEHQTGLAIDLNSISSSFAYTEEGQWIAEHCWEYGFILRYPADKVSITGYMYEPWHIRYVGKTNAQAIYESGLCLEEYLGIDSEYKY